MKNLVIVEVLKTTARNAKLVRADGKEFWVQGRWVRADKSLTSKGVEAFNNAGALADRVPFKPAPKRRPYYRVKYARLVEISPKAVKVECYDGSEDILPISQIREDGYHDAILVPTWLAEKKNIQYATKKIWLDA